MRTLAGNAATLQGQVSKDGTVSAGAFTRATKTVDSDRERPEFGQVASSSDVPLVQATSASISRPRASNRNRTSSSTIESRTDSTSGNAFSNRSSQTTNILDMSAGQSAISSPTGEEGLVTEEAPVDSPNGWNTGEGVALQDGPETRPEPVRKYTLTDEPLYSASNVDGKATSIVRTKRHAKGRQGSSSSVATTASRRSLAGLRRSSRQSMSEQQPSSPRLPLPEVEEHYDAYAGMAEQQPSEEVAGYFDSPVDVKGLSLRDEPRTISPNGDLDVPVTSRITISRNSSGGRPSTDRSGFI